MNCIEVIRQNCGLKGLASLLVAGLVSMAAPACVKVGGGQETVQESGYTVPFPLQEGGEKIDVLVRVADKERGYYFSLVFVEKQDWPKEKKDGLRRIFRGWTQFEEPIYPYPVKLRFQLDSTDDKSNVHVDQVVEKRNSAYDTLYPYRYRHDVIWRANSIYGRVLEPGVYRMRIENLSPCPEFDFETLFQFERNTRIP